MKGVILAGGNGTRLRPLTSVMNKHLLPVYDKPMILYPLETLKGFGITEILIVSGGEHLGWFTEFLGDGSKYGVKLTYRVQEQAGGIAEALGLAEAFVGNEKFMVILGDNVFGKIDPAASMSTNCRLWVKRVPDAKRFGVLNLDTNTITEKPDIEGEGLAVTGLYQYPPSVFEVIKKLIPSARGELEITDINNYYLAQREVLIDYVHSFWSDAGTFESLLRAANWAMDTFAGTQARDAMRHAVTRRKFNERSNALYLQGKKGIDVLYEKEPLKQFTYWKIIDNDFPYDRIAKRHHLLIPNRIFKDDWDMTDDERKELWHIKQTVKGYKAITENFPDRKSITEVYHLHLLEYDE